MTIDTIPEDGGFGNDSIRELQRKVNELVGAVGDGGLPDPLGASSDALVVDEDGTGVQWGYPSNLNGHPRATPVETSLVTGTLTPGAVGADRGVQYDDHFYGGALGTDAGHVNAGPMPGGTYLYFYGGDSTHRAGRVVISGSHEMAVVTGGNALVQGGEAIASSDEGEDAYDFQGGTAALLGGAASTIDGTSSGNGSFVFAEGSTAGVGGGIRIEGGVGALDTNGGGVAVTGGQAAGTGNGGYISIQGGQADDGDGGYIELRPGHATGAGDDGYIDLKNPANQPVVRVDETGLGFFGATPAARPTGDSSTITAEQIWQKLDALGLVEDTA